MLDVPTFYSTGKVILDNLIGLTELGCSNTDYFVYVVELQSCDTLAQAASVIVILINSDSVRTEARN